MRGYVFVCKSFLFIGPNYERDQTCCGGKYDKLVVINITIDFLSENTNSIVDDKKKREKKIQIPYFRAHII